MYGCASYFRGTTIKKAFQIQKGLLLQKKRGKEEGLRSLFEALRKRKSDLFDTLSMHGFDNVSLF